MAIAAGTIRSASRALALLELICLAPAPVSAKAAAERLEIALPSTYHLLKTLEVDGYIRRGAEGYSATGKVAEFAASWQSRLRPSDDALAMMNALATRTGETVYISGWIGGDVCIEAIAEGSQAVRVAGMYVGLRGHAYARASGRVLLAFSPAARREQYLGSAALEPLTPHTMTDLGAIRTELDQIADRGYAMDRSGFAPDVGCLSMPLHGQGVARAITVSAPQARFEANLEQLLALMTDVLDGRPTAAARKVG
jgi:IclR family transcriptional regulator, acetate operon repressor